MADTTGRERSATGIVLLTLAAGQFLMTLDSSVMNVSIATVAKDVHTTVTGIQTASVTMRCTVPWKKNTTAAAPNAVIRLA